jgi:hypothetical protein
VPVHDTEDKTWRHLDFFQYQAHLHAKLPRVRCPEHGVRQVMVSWARPGSGFTLLFEALLITFASAMPVTKVAAFTGEHDTRICRVLDHYVTAERAQLDFSGVERVGVDETAAARGQDYVSVFMDADAHRVLFASLCRAKLSAKAAELLFPGDDQAARRYSLMAPPRTRCRRTGALIGTTVPPGRGRVAGCPDSDGDDAHGNVARSWPAPCGRAVPCRRGRGRCTPAVRCPRTFPRSSSLSGCAAES